MKKNILYHCAVALCSLLYPLKWAFNLLPILPKMTPHEISEFLELPQSYIIGINNEAGVVIPSNVIKVYLDTNKVICNDPPFLIKEKKDLLSKLRQFTGFLPQKPDEALANYDQAFMTHIFDIDEDEKYPCNQV